MITIRIDTIDLLILLASAICWVLLKHWVMK